MGELIIFVSVGLLILLLSYLVKYKKQAGIISGYDENRVNDKDGYCNWFGSVSMWPGICAIVTGCLLYELPGYAIFIVAAFVVCTIVAIVIAVAGGKKFMNS